MYSMTLSVAPPRIHIEREEDLRVTRAQCFCSYLPDVTAGTGYQRMGHDADLCGTREKVSYADYYAIYVMRKKNHHRMHASIRGWQAFLDASFLVSEEEVYVVLAGGSRESAYIHPFSSSMLPHVLRVYHYEPTKEDRPFTTTQFHLIRLLIDRASIDNGDEYPPTPEEYYCRLRIGSGPPLRKDEHIYRVVMLGEGQFTVERTTIRRPA